MRLLDKIYLKLRMLYARSYPVRVEAEEKSRIARDRILACEVAADTAYKNAARMKTHVGLDDLVTGIYLTIGDRHRDTVFALRKITTELANPDSRLRALRNYERLKHERKELFL